LKERIYDLTKQIWEEEHMPSEWKIGLICSIYEKEINWHARIIVG
jgi:hypothetical protein